MNILSYQTHQKKLWNSFVNQSKNGTFLFDRNYMDYHRDRFDDASLIFIDNKQQPIALLPANKTHTNFISHGGLTYGGFIIDSHMKSPMMLEIFSATLTFLKEQGYQKFIYKTIPHIYYQQPAEEDRYALFLHGATLFRRDLLSVIDMQNKPPFQERRRRGIKKAKQHGLEIKLSDDYNVFWQILAEVLMAQHQTKPVHSISELQLLASYFPDNIKLYACYDKSSMVAGIMVYETNKVAKMQYIAANSIGKELGALDLIFDDLINTVYSNKAFFDFGCSTTENGKLLNKGLIEQKEGFGGRAITQDFYEIDLTI